jgi:hypothetical protein
MGSGARNIFRIVAVQAGRQLTDSRQQNQTLGPNVQNSGTAQLENG